MTIRCIGDRNSDQIDANYKKILRDAKLIKLDLTDQVVVTEWECRETLIQGRAGNW